VAGDGLGFLTIGPDMVFPAVGLKPPALLSQLGFQLPPLHSRECTRLRVASGLRLFDSVKMLGETPAGFAIGLSETRVADNPGLEDGIPLGFKPAAR